MKKYDHHDPECDTDNWMEEAIGEADYYYDENIG